MSFFWVGHFEFFFRKKNKIFCFIPMKISPNLYGRMDGSNIWCFPWFPENSLLCVILCYTVYLFIRFDKDRMFLLSHHVTTTLNICSAVYENQAGVAISSYKKLLKNSKFQKNSACLNFEEFLDFSQLHPNFHMVKSFFTA